MSGSNAIILECIDQLKQLVLQYLDVYQTDRFLLTPFFEDIMKKISLLGCLAFALLIGCPDPNASSSGMGGSTTTTGTDGTTTTNAGSQETDPSAARLNCAEGDANCISISGSLVYDGTPSGSIRLDVQKVREGSAPMLIHTLELQEIGAFSFDAPKGYGKIIITGFIDEAGDGPSPKDPQGRTNVDIGEEAMSDIQLVIKADNAPIQPKPPSDQPADSAKGSNPNDSSKGEAKSEGDNPTNPPPVQNDGPPADE